MVGLADLEVFKEDLIQLVIIVLTSVYQDVITGRVQARNDPRQANDLRSRPHDRHHFELVHGFTLETIVSGRSGSKTSFAHNITTNSSPPMLVMLWAHPGT